METLIPMDPRKLPALVRRMHVSQRELAQRASVRPDELSRFFSAIQPGGLMDRVVGAVAELAAEADPRS